MIECALCKEDTGRKFKRTYNYSLCYQCNFKIDESLDFVFYISDLKKAELIKDLQISLGLNYPSLKKSPRNRISYTKSRVYKSERDRNELKLLRTKQRTTEKLLNKLDVQQKKNRDHLDNVLEVFKCFRKDAIKNSLKKLEMKQAKNLELICEVKKELSKRKGKQSRCPKTSP